MLKHPLIEEDIQNIVDGIGDEAVALEGKTLLISGGSGFLGSYWIAVIHALNKKFKNPCRVISFDNYVTAPRENLIHTIKNSTLVSLEGDVAKPLPNIEGPVDYIVHAAGIASPFYYRKYPLETIEAAVTGSKNFLELARLKKPKGFLFFSSSEIYGDPDSAHIPTPETYKGNVSCVGPRSCYDESKRLSETLSLVYHELFNIPIKIVRPFNIYGPGMKIDDYRVIPSFANRGLHDEPLPVHGNGNQTRTFCYISDAMVGFFKVLISGAPGGIYNIGTEKDEVSMQQLGQMVVDIIGKGSVKLIEYPDSYPADEPTRRCPDISKARTELAYSPVVDLRRGIERTMQWYRDAYSLGG